MRWLFLLLLLLPVDFSLSMMAMPGTCGTWCMGPSGMMNMWGRPQFYPPVYAYPYGPSPMSFYGNPMGYWNMMSPYMVPSCPMCGVRGIAEDKEKK